MSTVKPVSFLPLKWNGWMGWI